MNKETKLTTGLFICVLELYPLGINILYSQLLMFYFNYEFKESSKYKFSEGDFILLTAVVLIRPYSNFISMQTNRIMEKLF